MVFICQAHIFIGMKDGKYGVWFCTDVQMMPSAPYAPCDRILFRWPWGWICLWSCTADPQETPTGAWTDMAPTSAPSARMNGTAVYETRDKTMMIFGGLCSATEPCATLIWADGWMSLNGCGMSGGGGVILWSHPRLAFKFCGKHCEKQAGTGLLFFFVFLVSLGVQGTRGLAVLWQQQCLDEKMAI